MRRGGGVLMHISSLPGPFGIGGGNSIREAACRTGNEILAGASFLVSGNG